MSDTSRRLLHGPVIPSNEAAKKRIMSTFDGDDSEDDDERKQLANDSGSTRRDFVDLTQDHPSEGSIKAEQVHVKAESSSGFRPTGINVHPGFDVGLDDVSASGSMDSHVRMIRRRARRLAKRESLMHVMRLALCIADAILRRP